MIYVVISAAILLAILWFARPKVRYATPGEPFLPFRQRCHCGADPTPFGTAYVAVVLGITPSEVKEQHGILCAKHMGEHADTLGVPPAIMGSPSWDAAMLMLRTASDARADTLVSGRVGGPDGVHLTFYSSGREITHDPPLSEDEWDTMYGG